MAVHNCTECGLMHDAIIAEEREPVEVTIARINADRDIAVARAAIRQDEAYNETRVEVAKIESGAMVDAAEVQAEVIGAAIEGSDQEPPEPLEIVAPEFVNNDVEVNEDAPPAPEGSPVPAPEKKTSFGAW